MNWYRLVQGLKSIALITSFTIIFFASLASGNNQVSLQVTGPKSLNRVFSVDDRFGVLGSGYIKLKEGTHEIYIRSADQSVLPFRHAMFELTIKSAKLEISSHYFSDACTNKEIYVKEWPIPIIVEDEKFPGAFRLVITDPIIEKRNEACIPPKHDMGNWDEVGIFRLNITSLPPGSEIWVDREFIGKTNAAVNVPYHEVDGSLCDVEVVISREGYLNCNWILKKPFNRERRLKCVHEKPGIVSKPIKTTSEK